MELDHIIAPLQRAETLEGEAHRLFNDAVSNLAYGHLPEEMRERYVQQTYQATRKHATAMEALRTAIDDLYVYRGALRDALGAYDDSNMLSLAETLRRRAAAADARDDGEIAIVRLAQGRYVLWVGGVVVAMETDLCRDPNIVGRTWTRDMLREAARRINGKEAPDAI